MSKEDYRKEVLIGEYYSLLKLHKNKEAVAFVEEYFPKHLSERIKRDGHKNLSKQDFEAKSSESSNINSIEYESSVVQILRIDRDDDAKTIMVKKILNHYNALVLNGKREQGLHFAKQNLPEDIYQKLALSNESVIITKLDVIKKYNDVAYNLHYVSEPNFKLVKVYRTYKITYKDGTSVEATAEHPFYILGRGWTPVKELKVGDESETIKRKGLKIISIEIKDSKTPVTVYNFEVEGDHNYFVGASGVLVHNDCKFTEKPIQYKELPKGFFRDEYGNIPEKAAWAGTGLEFVIELNPPKKNPEGTYSIKVKTFEVEVQTIINTDKNLEWKNINDFKDYYKKDKVYTIKDVDQDFTTKGGTEYHESLHRKVAKDTFDKYKNEIESEIGKIKDTDFRIVIKKAREKLLDYKSKIQKEFYDKKDHDRIRVDTWNYFRTIYEKEVLNKKDQK